MNVLRMIIENQIYLALLFCVATAFPTEVTISSESEFKSSTTPSRNINSTEFVTASESKPSNASSISTTSSLLFKDKKPILTYLLGQPKKQGSLSSPAQLLSPDRYEFFTFDDDGQIVKKLMSVAEIQKIIANNEKGSLGEHGTPIEYYQILTVTPDVESIPSVSRINPNEPLFSIHDVIASVQNVLKSEIKMKQSQSTSKLNNTNYVASASSEHFEILTETPQKPYEVEVQKISSPAVQHTTSTPPSTFTIRQKLTGKPEKLTTYRPQEINYTFIQETVATTNTPITSKPLESAAFTAPQVPVSLVSSAPIRQSSPINPSSQNTFVFTTSSNKFTETPAKVAVSESQPLSLSDAHPGLISNETFLDMKPFTVEQISRIAEPIIQTLKVSPPKQSSENFVKVETLEPLKEQIPAKATTSESSTSKIEIAITPDLAESVSSVISQIASEISLTENLNKPTEPVILSTETKLPADFQNTETTEKPVQLSTSTELLAQNAENPLTALENILRPQNRPRPFQKIPLIEKGTPEVVESRTESLSTATPNYELISSPSSTVVILTQEEDATLESKKPLNSNNKTQESFPTTAVPQSFVVSVSPDAVVQSPEQIKPVTDKVVISNLNDTKNNQSQQTIEGVQVIQEANIGQIPRSTESPVQTVKEVQKPEVSNTEIEIPAEKLSNSASNTFSTQLPFTAPEVTTVIENVEGKTEIPEKQQIVEETTEIRLEVAETKSTNNEDLKETSASDRIDITFVPMVIKTPTVFKQESVIEIENQQNLKEEIATTVKPEEENKLGQTEMSEEVVTEISHTTVEQESVESKELPESAPELQSEPKPATEVNQKEKVVVVGETNDDLDFQIGTLKQNIPNKPDFGKKPLKPVYIKPVKVKQPTETKPILSKPTATVKPFLREPAKDSENKKPYENHLQSSPSVLELDAAPDENLGLEATVVNLDGDVKRFADLCNELAFSLWSSVTHNGLSFVRSVVVSPFAVTSLLAMVFLGARGPTSGQMNDILKLDDMVTFNPHLVFRNVTESLVISRNPGVATTAFVRELYSDKSKGKLLDFYKERVQQFYDGHVEEVNFKTIGDTLRRQTNHLVKRQTWGKITDFLRGSNLMPRPPLAAFSANIFQTDCTRASTKDRDGEMYFVILPASRLRRLVPIPAVVWRDSFLAGYEPNLDATAVSINPSDSAVSTIFVLPGQQGLIAPGDTLARLEHHLLGSSYKKGHWSRLMRSLLPRPGLELQIPRLSHKSVINVTSSLQRMGLKDLFSADKADLTGLNGLANDLHLSDMLQVNLFSTCGEEPIGARHHSEIYPATPILRREKSADNIFSESVDNLFAVSDFEDPAISALPLELRPRQARVPLSSPGVRIPEPPRLRFDRPFLFFVRHNPTGLILHMGRFNPRLMP